MTMMTLTRTRGACFPAAFALTCRAASVLAAYLRKVCPPR